MPRAQDIQEHWDESWGRVDYQSDQFAEIISKLDDRLGQVVVDIGSGANPVTRLLSRDTHKVIEIDLASDEIADLPNTLRLRFDIEDVIKSDRDTTRMAIAKIMQFLGINIEECDGSRQSLERVDAFVFSQILNYVDYKAVLRAAKKHLKPGGELILNEGFGLALRDVRSEGGITDFQDLATFLREEGYMPGPIIRGQTNRGERIIWRLKKG